MDKIKNLLNWLKKNWYWLLVVPVIFYGIYKAAKFAVIMFSDDDSGPDLTELERTQNDEIEKLNRQKEEERKKIEEEAKKKRDELSSGEKKPADVFNDELDGK
uniref:Uncharacterized protein n=1 Tax=viral metagenome TaxID=1070528 RepID=A0A6H2A1F9_9ZZZZ